MEYILETEGLGKRFGGLVAANNVNFRLKEGEIKALIGPNGAGKTTFFNLVTGVYTPDSGTIVFMGKDITRYPISRRCRDGLSRTYQISSIFPGQTVSENVRLSTQIGYGRGLSPFWHSWNIKEVTGRVEHILDLLGLMELSSKLAGETSQGDQRLLEVAIALGSKPKVLLLDEPTAGLSRFETGQLTEKIQSLFDRSIIRSIVLVEHDIEVVTSLAQTICVLNYGEVIKDGPTPEVCADAKVQEVYLQGGKTHADH